MEQLFKSLEKEVVIITNELHKKQQSGKYTVPFYWTLTCPHQYKNLQPFPSSDALLPVSRNFIREPTEREWGWRNPSFVKLPFSRFYTFKWKLIQEKLSVLHKLATDPKEKSSERCIELFKDAVWSYCDKARVNCNFKVIQDDPLLCSRLKHVLPGIIENAIKLSARLEHPIPILKRGESHTLCLTRDLACSLLANAFLCTLPEQEGRNLHHFHFYRLFDDSSSDTTKAQVKREKLKCILTYFEQMTAEEPPHQNTVITFERRYHPHKFPWNYSSEPLCRLQLRCNEKLEVAAGMLQVDFANRTVGGGVLGDGAVQEEIRFCINPELICARLFTQTLDHDEVLVITGTAQFSSYTGYSSTFGYKALESTTNVEGSIGIDNLGREYTQVVAMDALHFPHGKRYTQYRTDKIQRELHKSYVAFMQGKHSTPVATGNWGCGVFNGDPQLKFLIQWMAASVNQRSALVFHANDDEQMRDLDKMATILTQKWVTVSELYRILMKYESKCMDTRRNVATKMTVFQFVKKCVTEK